MGVFSAFIPLLEVKEKYQKRRIGKELIKKIEQKLQGRIYLCDPSLAPFYSKGDYIVLSGQAKRFSE